MRPPGEPVARVRPPAPAGEGTPMKLVCPHCDTRFKFMRGPGEVEVECPSCGARAELAALGSAGAMLPVWPG